MAVQPTVQLQSHPSQSSWANLMRWCKNIYEGESYGHTGDDIDEKSNEVVLAAAHGIVFQYGESQRSWDECATNLENLRKVVHMFDPRWN